MGTTLTALLFDGGRLGMAHVGDSRAYLYRGGVLHQLTHDDTFVQSLIDDGRITQEEAAHHPQRSLLLRALNGTEVDPSLTIREVTAGDRYLICSDGLPGVVSAEAIAEALANPDPGVTADALIQLALVGGGPDNITVIVADVVDTGVGSGPTDAGTDFDPDATGPIGTVSSVRMTQEMPRVPLPPIPEDVPARAEYVPADETDQPTSAAAQGVSGPPAAGRSGRRRGAWWLVAGVVVLAVAAIIGSYFWVRSQYFVGAEDGVVVVYRGVNGSVLGVQLSSLEEESCEPGLQLCAPLKVQDLVPAAQAQVSAGIQAGTLDDARNVITRLAGQMLPPCPVAGAPTTTTSPPLSGQSSSGALPGTTLTRATATPPPPAGSGTAGLATPVPPVSPPATETPAIPTGAIPTDAAGSTAPLGSGAPVSTLANGSVVTAQNGTSPLATGTPLSTRAPEPGVTCRVVK
jgi:protein phosphatase